MQINWGGVQICKGTSRLDPGPTDLVLNGKRLHQTSQGLRWAQSVERDRLNSTNELRFVIKREHGTPAQAEFFQLTHKLALDKVGIATLTLVAYDGSGANTATCYLLNAVLPEVQIKITGMISFSTYTFQAGAMTTAKPTG